jgi:hypothetical protein
MYKKRIEIELPFGFDSVELVQEWNDMTDSEYMKVANVIFYLETLSIESAEMLEYLHRSIIEILLHQTTGFLQQLRNAYLVKEGIEEGEASFAEYLSFLKKNTSFIFVKKGKKKVFINHARTVLCENQRKLKSYEGAMSIKEQQEPLTNKQKLKDFGQKKLHSSINKWSKRNTVNWYAPADGLDNISIYEWVHLAQHYEAYLSLRKANSVEGIAEAEQEFDNLLAVLYRPASIEYKTRNFKGKSKRRDREDISDPRQLLFKHEDKVKDRAAQWANLRKNDAQVSLIFRRSILFWYLSCRQSIIEQYPYCFNQSAKTIEGSTNYNEFLVGIAEGPNTDDLATRNLHNVFTALNMRFREIDEANRKAEAMQ